jgi:propionyl-CoA synthetase
MTTLERIEDIIDVPLWEAAAKDIDWFKPPSSVLGVDPEQINPYTWFPNGELNTCYNSLGK